MASKTPSMNAGLDYNISYAEGHAAAEVNCRMGYTEHNAAFALLHLILLGCSPRSTLLGSMLLSGLATGSTAVTVAIHGLLGGVCFSPTISAVVHANFVTFPVVRAGSSVFVVNSLANAAVAAHFVDLKSEGFVRVAKLLTLSVLALVNIVAQGWWWTHDLTRTLQDMVLLPASLLNLLGPIFVYSATKSRPVALGLCFATGIAAVLAALNRAFPVDLEGRPMHEPHLDYLDYNSQNLHWALSLRQFLISTGIFFGRAAIIHTLIASQSSSRASRLAPPLAAGLPALTPSASFRWLWLSAGVVIVAVFSQVTTMPWNNTPTGTPGRRPLRELLGMVVEQDVRMLWWCAQWLLLCIGLSCVALLILMVIRKRRYDEGPGIDCKAESAGIAQMKSKDAHTSSKQATFPKGAVPIYCRSTSMRTEYIIHQPCRSKNWRTKLCAAFPSPEMFCCRILRILVFRIFSILYQGCTMAQALEHCPHARLFHPPSRLCPPNKLGQHVVYQQAPAHAQHKHPRYSSRPPIVPHLGQ